MRESDVLREAGERTCLGSGENGSGAVLGCINESQEERRCLLLQAPHPAGVAVLADVARSQVEKRRVPHQRIGQRIRDEQLRLGVEQQAPARPSARAGQATGVLTERAAENVLRRVLHFAPGRAQKMHNSLTDKGISPR